MSLTTAPSTDPPAAVEPVGACPPTELIDLHARAGVLIAELGTGPGQAAASVLVARLIGEVEQVLDDGHRPVGAEAPFVVQCRQLALAQRRMVVALERGDAVATESAVVRSRALLAELADLAAGHRATPRR